MPDFFGDSLGAADQFFGMPPIDEEQRKRLLRTPPFLPPQSAGPRPAGPIDSQDFADTAKARQATDAAPVGAQTAELNEVRLPERAARTATPPTTGSAMDSPAFNALVTPRAATTTDRYNEWESRAPERPPVPNPGLKRRALEGLTTAGASLVNPLLGRVVNNLWEGPQYAAQKQYGQARQAWEDEGKGIVQGAQLANLQSEMDYRQAEGRRADAQAAKDLREKPTITADKKVDEGFNDKGQRVVTWERADGTRYSEVNPQIVQKQDKTAELQEDQRFEQIDSARRLGQPVSPQDKAWADAYKNRKTLGQQVINVGAELRGKAFGRNRPTQVLDTWNGNRPVVVSAGEAEDNPQRYVTQSGGEKSLPKEALVNDIRVSAENVKKNLAVLDSSGIDRVKLAAALADPNSTAQSYLQAIPRGSLDENGQQFVADLFNLREQAMAMRSVLGAGQGSEDMRRAILSTLPGVASPSSKFGAKQIDNLIGVLDRVERGIPQVPLAPQRGGQGGGGKDLGAAPAGRAEGSTGTLPDGTKVRVVNGRIVSQ